MSVGISRYVAGSSYAEAIDPGMMKPSYYRESGVVEWLFRHIELVQSDPTADGGKQFLQHLANTAAVS